MKVFIHIPKTGGTSLVNTLAHQIYFKKFKRLNPTKNIHPKEFMENATHYLDDVVSKGYYEVVGGHFGFGAHPDLTEQSKYFTVLRNPINRVYSEYNFMKFKGTYYQKWIAEEGITLNDYLFHKKTSYLNNFQTRLVSGIGFEKWEEVNDIIYKKAAANLKGFLAVGLTERMPETLALFYNKLNWSRLPIMLKNNVNIHKSKEALLEQDAQEIAKREKYDLMLYKLATELFEVSLRQFPKVEKLSDKIAHGNDFNRLFLKFLNKWHYL